MSAKEGPMTTTQGRHLKEHQSSARQHFPKSNCCYFSLPIRIHRGHDRHRYGAYCTCLYSTHLGFELSDNVKVQLEVSSKNAFNDEKSKSLHLSCIQVSQEVVLRYSCKDLPAGSSMMILQYRSIIVQHSLHKIHILIKNFSPKHKYRCHILVLNTAFSQ